MEPAAARTLVADGSTRSPDIMHRTLAAATLLLALSLPCSAQADLTSAVRLMMFSDASYQWTERDVAEGFSLGQVVGHLNAVLTDRLYVAAEATITSRSAGPLATIERVILGYDFSDAFRLSVGRYHTPVSWWNTQYHHGLWLQTSIDRPNMVRFGTPLVPVHFMGLLATGTVPVGRSFLIYEAGVGNGRQPDLVSAGDAGEEDGAAAFIGGLRFRPSVLRGLEVGAHGYIDEVDAGTGPVDERIVGGHAVWLRNPEVVIEYLHFIHDPQAEGAASRESDAWYAQLGWKLPHAPTIQPYVRYESVEIDANDPLFDGLGLGYEGVIGGVRWDFVRFVALKGEFRSEEHGAGDRANSVVLNVSFVIPNILE